VTQTLAIFLEAYRNLNSRKLFWIVLAISALVVLAFACVGINEKGIKVVAWQIDSSLFNATTTPPAVFYKSMFTSVGIGLWLSWLATILALISTAGIFPDLMTSGSIDLLVSKPIGRLRLFLTEYVAGLLFVTLQVTVFTLLSFLVIGLRGGVWEPGLLVAVPLVICFFSYLFSVCVLLGILTRSTVAALLLTLLFWFFVYGVGAAEQGLLVFKTMQNHGVDFQTMPREQAGRGPAVKGAKDRPESGGSSTKDAPGPAEAPAGSPALDAAHRIVYGVKTVLPKTSETIALLQRTLVRMADLPEQPDQDQRMGAVQRELVETLRSRSVTWIVGTSLVFELAILSWAAWLFCRRDF